MRRLSGLPRILADWIVATGAGRRDGDPFARVERFCLFVGYSRSGHSIVGALLDAHPRAVIAHELDALRYVHLGFDRRRLFHLLRRKAAADATAGRVSGAYSYAVPGAWQGRHTTIAVIGDKKAEASTFRLDAIPGLLERVRRIVRVPVRFIHVVRNPFDNIATIAVRATESRGRAPGPPDLEAAADRYFRLCAAVTRLRHAVEPEAMVELRHEDFIADPAGALAGLCRWLGLEPEPDYLARCAGIVKPSARQSRRLVGWSPAVRASVESRAAAIPHLSGYGFDS